MLTVSAFGRAVGNCIAIFEPYLYPVGIKPKKNGNQSALGLHLDRNER